PGLGGGPGTQRAPAPSRSSAHPAPHWPADAPPPRPHRPAPRSDRNPPQGEPPPMLALDRKLVAHLGLQDKLALHFALLLAPRRDKGVEQPALVVVDPVQ